MQYDKSNPFLAKITVREAINKSGSDKCTMRVVLDISGSGLFYKVGDSIGIYPLNDDKNVSYLLHILNATGDEQVQNKKTEEIVPLKTLLTKNVCITRLNKKIVRILAGKQVDPKRQALLNHYLNPQNSTELKQFCDTHELRRLLEEHDNIQWDLHEFVNMLPPLLPRFYSIASSQAVDHNKIELLIAYLDYTNDHQRKGVCSHYICDLAPMYDSSIPLFLHPSKNFTLPQDSSKSIIMVGPGTGIAPFRGFIQERQFKKATGKNWLFFGERRKAFDYFYQDIFEQLQTENVLRISTAFSRDSEQKMYVQNKMLEEAKDIWTWLDSGAYFYVCGDAFQMARSVDQALRQIIQEQGNMSEEEAKTYIKRLKEEGRYLKDIY